MKKLVVCCLFFICAASAFALETPDSIIRVGILENIQSFFLSCEGSFALVEIGNGKKIEFASPKTLQVKFSEGGFLIEGDFYKAPLRAVSLESGKALKADGRRYSDSLLIRKASKGGFHVINELGLDGYVNGILPKEVNSRWPLESLKAQAVASRTYALRNLHRHDSEGYQLCSKVHCQVFGGLESETKETTRAVSETHNEIALYEEEPAQTYFFSNCGGRTENPRNVWENSSAPKYLGGVRCKFCGGGGHYTWEKQVGGDLIANALLKGRVIVVPPIHAVKTISKSKSGRALVLAIQHDGGEIKILSSRFRMLLGPDKIRSTQFDKIKKSGDGFLFQGHGWGHGVGMCQEGARGMALKGYAYKKIIQQYYPGVKIKKFED